MANMIRQIDTCSSTAGNGYCF